MNKAMLGIAVLLVCLVSACGGNVDVYEAPKNSCQASPYKWGDPVLFVCANPLPVPHPEQGGDSMVGLFSFMNYGQSGTNVGHLCIRNVGASSLQEVEFITIIHSGVQTISVHTLMAPWPEGERACADFDLQVESMSQGFLMVSFQSKDKPYFEKGTEYQIEITSASDVVLHDMDSKTSVAVVGEFPVRSEVVTMVGAM